MVEPKVKRDRPAKTMRVEEGYLEQDVERVRAPTVFPPCAGNVFCSIKEKNSVYLYSLSSPFRKTLTSASTNMPLVAWARPTVGLLILHCRRLCRDERLHPSIAATVVRSRDFGVKAKRIASSANSSPPCVSRTRLILLTSIVVSFVTVEKHMSNHRCDDRKHFIS